MQLRIEEDGGVIQEFIPSLEVFEEDHGIPPITELTRRDETRLSLFRKFPVATPARSVSFRHVISPVNIVIRQGRMRRARRATKERRRSPLDRAAAFLSN